MTRSLGRLEPTDWKHVQKYGLRQLTAEQAESVEKLLKLPYHYRLRYDQGQQGACVGFSLSWMMSILNKPFYDANWLYKEAQKTDEWAGEDYSGTTVRAGMDVLRNVGHKLLHKHKHEHEHAPESSHGIAENRWATSVDDIRLCIDIGVPVVMGTNWYSAFDDPQPRGREHWVPSDNLGRIRGGHAWCIYGASDKRQAFKMVNSWGREYPLTWFPYSVVERLLREDGEATMVTDRS